MNARIASAAALIAASGLLQAPPAIAAETAPLKTVPVKRLPPKPEPKPRPKVSSGPDAWLSAGGGLARRGDASLVSKGFAGYVGNDAAIFGFRARFLEGFQSLRHGRELGLLAGGRFGPRDQFWAAIGIAELEYEQRNAFGVTVQRREGTSVPVEIVFAPHGRYVGGELRFEASFSENLPVYTLGTSFSFGKP